MVAAGRNEADIGREMGRDRTFIVRKHHEHGIQRGQSAELTIMMARLDMRRLLRRARAM